MLQNTPVKFTVKKKSCFYMFVIKFVFCVKSAKAYEFYMRMLQKIFSAININSRENDKQKS